MPHTVPFGLLDRPCRCLAAKVVRADGVAFGLTDADAPFVHDGLAYSPVAGVSSSSVESELGAAAGRLSFRTLDGVGGALATSITAEDLRGGLYADADVWILELDPTAPELGPVVRGRYRVSRATIKRAEKSIELRETLSLLQLQTGRTVSGHCDVEVWGNRRCDPSQTIRAANSFSRALATVVALDTLLFSGDAHPTDFYSNGEVEWTSGRNAGLTMQVKRHDALAGNVAQIVLSTPLNSILSGFVPAPGDVATLVRGCDRSFPCCQGVPNPHEATGTNAPNYQGYKSVPLTQDIQRIGRQAKS